MKRSGEVHWDNAKGTPSHPGHVHGIISSPLAATYLLRDAVRPMLLSNRIPACEGGISGLKFLFASEWDAVTRYFQR